MSTWQQQDAQEYYSKLLDQIDNEIAKAARALQGSPGLEPDNASCDSSASQYSDDSGYHSIPPHSKAGLEPRLSRNPLEGLMAQRVACVNCGYCEGLTMIPFNCVTLTLGNFPEHDLYERLDHYTKVESIEGVECPKCSLLMCRELVKTLAERTGDPPALRQRLQSLEEALEDEAFDETTLMTKCNITAKMRASSTKTKQVALARAPQSLVFHVNRSGFDESTGYMFKNSAAVRFPMVFDLGPWCLGSANGPMKLEEDASPAQEEVEQWTLDPRASMVAGDDGTSRITGPLYELRAVVTHFGHHENGHYICYRKHPLSAPPSPTAVTTPTDQSPRSPASEAAELDHEMRPVSEASESPPSQDEPQSQWWRLSDENVTLVDERTVLSQGGVFMLFYDCVDPTPALAERLDKPLRSDDVVQDIACPDATPASPVAIQSPEAAPREDESLANSAEDSGVALPLDSMLPLPGAARATYLSSEIPEAEVATTSHDQAMIPGPELVSGASGAVDVATTSAGCVGEATPFFLARSPLDPLPPV
jgi:ubiquitin carboxyl-terminal hydrolase 1